MKLKIMTWNIKGESSLGWNNQYVISSKVVDKVIAQEADVVVLTAFVVTKGIDYLFERFQNEGYIWFISNRSGKNGILIAIKECFVDNKKLINEVYNGNAISSVIEGCNILRVLLPLKCGINLGIIGCRMETGGFKDNKKQQYDSENEAFNKVLLPILDCQNKSDLYIVCGDFNNARCLGNLSKKYCKEDYYGKDQCNYNLNIIKDSFEKLGFIMTDIDKNGNAIPTYNKYIPNDHIFVRGGICDRDKCSVIPADGLSDHDIVMADVQILEFER